MRAEALPGKVWQGRRGFELLVRNLGIANRGQVRVGNLGRQMSTPASKLYRIMPNLTVFTVFILLTREAVLYNSTEHERLRQAGSALAGRVTAGIRVVESRRVHRTSSVRDARAG